MDRDKEEPWPCAAYLMRAKIVLAVEKPQSPAAYSQAEELLADLNTFAATLTEVGAAALVTDLIVPVRQRLQAFGFHSASLDVRQNSAFHEKALDQLLRAAGLLDERSFIDWSVEQKRALLDRELRSPRPLDDIEDAMLAGRHDHGGELANLRRMAVRLQRLLAPEPTALARTLSNPPAWIGREDLQRLHGAADDYALVQRDVAALQDRVKLLQDEAARRVAEGNNASLFTLTMVTVLALPINLIAALMGMNVGGVPLAEHRGGFWWTLVLIGALTALIAWFALPRLRRPKRRPR